MINGELIKTTYNMIEEKLAKKINEIYVEDMEGCFKVAKSIINSQ